MRTMNGGGRRWAIALIIGLAIAIVLAGAYLWQRTQSDEQGAIASGNGRIEATEIDIAAKTPGRLAEIHVSEGEFVAAGQVLARMDTRTLEAELRQAQAQLGQARSAVATARSQLSQAESEKAAAEAVLVQNEAEYEAARRQWARSSELAEKGAISEQVADNDRARVLSAQAGVRAAEAQISAAQAAIVTAGARIDGAEADVAAVQATIERIEAELDDSRLEAPRDGRVQYIVARPGEVVGAGGPVLNLVDLSDVYMTFFLPTRAAGRVALGTEVRLVLDAAPRYTIPANVSFVADVAQFTPRTVETQAEREKLMFRVRARIPPDLLRRHLEQVKTGLPGVAYVRLDPEMPWPPELAQNLVQ